MKTSKLAHALGLALMACMTSVWALAQQSSGFDAYQREETRKQAEFVRKQMRMEQDYIQKEQEKLSDYLKKEWQNYQLYMATKAPVRPTPVHEPVYKPTQQATPGQQLPVKEREGILGTPAKPWDMASKPQPSKERQYVATPVFFFGNQLTFTCDKTCKSPLEGVNTKSVAAYWDALAESDLQPLMYELLETQQQLGLHDWGVYLLAQRVAQGLHSKANEQVLLTAYMMDMLGYDVRFGLLPGQKLILLPAIQNTVYGMSSLTMGRTQYYAPGYASRLEISSYPEMKDKGQKRPLDLHLHSPLNLGWQVQEHTIAAQHLGTAIKVLYSPLALEYYAALPATTLDVPFNAHCSATIEQSLFPGIQAALQGQSEIEALNSVLGMVQRGFEYQSDLEQFGGERSFYFEEMFAYPYSDCEDRAILFARIVREVLGLEVLGLDYPDHVCTAVKVTQELPYADYVLYRGNKYVVCDPTYINALVGSSMPQYRSRSAKVIEVR